MKRWLIRSLLFIPAFLIAACAMIWVWVWHTQSGAEWVWQQAQQQILRVSPEATLDGKLKGTLGGELRMTSVAYRDEYVDARAEEATLKVSLSFFPPGIESASLGLNDVDLEIFEYQDDQKDRASENPLDLKLPWPVTVDDLAIRNLNFSRGDFSQNVHDIQASLTWHQSLALNVTTLETKEISGVLNIQAGLVEPFAFESGLKVNRLTTPDSFREQAPWIPENIDVQASVTGTVNNIDIAGALLWPDWLPVGEFSGNVNFDDSLTWSLELMAAGAELPGRWVKRTIGTGIQDLSENLNFRSISLIASGNEAGFELNGETALQAPWIKSEKIALVASGTYSGLESWSLRGDAEISAAEWPSGRIDFAALGSDKDLSLNLTAPHLFGGSLELDAQTLIPDGNRWTASIRSQSVAVPPLLQALRPHLDEDLINQLDLAVELLGAESLDAEIDANGSQDPLAVTLDIHHLTTDGGSRSVTANGKLDFDQSGSRTSGLTIASRGSSVQIAGQLNSEPSAEIEFAIVDLGDIFPETKGSLQGRAFYRHDPGQGFNNDRVRGNIEGQALEAFGWKVGQLRISEMDYEGIAASYSVFDSVEHDPPLELSIDLENIEGPAGTFPSAFALLAGRLDDLALVAQAETQESMMLAELTGGNVGQSFEIWQGTLHGLEVHPALGPSWTLQEPAQIAYRDGYTAEAVCLETSGEASLCIDAERNAMGGEKGRVIISLLPPNLIGPPAEWPMTFSQRISGEMTWQRSDDLPLSAQVDLSISEGEVINEADNFVLVKTGESTLSFNLEEGSLTSGTLDIPLNSGVIDIDFALEDILQGTDSPIDGRIRVDLNNLEALSVLVPRLAQVSGSLSLDLKLSGSGQDPYLSGTTTLTNGRMYLVATGLRLSDVELTGELDTENQLRLDGSFLAGKGNGSLQATVDVSEPLHPTFDARLVGEGMRLVNTPEIQLIADSDVSFSWSADESLNILGTVHVPSARFAPQYLPSDTASESPDVILISNGEPIESAQVEPSKMKIFGDLAVSLGDDVVIDLDLARAKATGSTMFSWRGENLPIANGEYNLRGDIQAYGQTLEITRASVRYPNVPASNPLIDVRAERTIFGNSLIQKAGVLVSGTLQRPQTEPYTVPATDADRARALLITGSDFDYEQGVGAVNVGAYIAPKLYLSYGVGLFEEGNVFTARYELRRNFGVKATSGQDETGIDFNYTIER
ncbi:MAG TPA: translocation/assembly module TamB domain-containing protein [Xanthomonadales bacterium]|nr:translocation/assembly module TamB domain-containing protein [Xanthomonadales bacterium]